MKFASIWRICFFRCTSDLSLSLRSPGMYHRLDLNWSQFWHRTAAKEDFLETFFFLALAGHFPSGQEEREWVHCEDKTWLPGLCLLSALTSFSLQSPHINHPNISPCFYNSASRPASFSFTVVCPHCSLTVSWSSLSCSGLFYCEIRLGKHCWDVWNHRRLPPLFLPSLWAPASHSCVTSAASQPSTNGPGCPAAWWPVCTLCGRIGRVGNLNIKDQVILPPNIELPPWICMDSFDLCCSYCFGLKWIFMLFKNISRRWWIFFTVLQHKMTIYGTNDKGGHQYSSIQTGALHNLQLLFIYCVEDPIYLQPHSQHRWHNLFKMCQTRLCKDTK